MALDRSPAQMLAHAGGGGEVDVAPEQLGGAAAIGAGPIPQVQAQLAAGPAHGPGATGETASEQAFGQPQHRFNPHTETHADGSTLTTGGPEGPVSTHATGDRGPQHVQHGYMHGGNYYGMPQIYTGDLQADLVTNRGSAVAWARERRELHINTVGPEGSEQSFPYSWLGRAGGAEVQYFAAFHDVQSVEALVQAMYSGRMAAFHTVNTNSAIRGYDVARGRGGAAAAEITRQMYDAAGFTVSGPAQLDVGPAPPQRS